MKDYYTPTRQWNDGLSGKRFSEIKDLESRKAFKVRLETVLSEALSEQYDCNITIKLKPEPDELDEMQADSENEQE